MRWVVELPAESGGTGPTVTADGDSWKAALSVARSGQALPKFRCDFDEDGTVRVWDMITNEHFVVRPIGGNPKAAHDAGAEGRWDDDPPATVQPSEPESPPSVLVAPTPMRATTPTAFAVAHQDSQGTSAAPGGNGASHAAQAPHAELASVVVDPVALRRPTPVPVRAEFVEPSVLSPGTLVFQRNREPTAATPLIYKERVVTVPLGTPTDVADRVARDLWWGLKTQLQAWPRGQFVAIAVFDHAFHSLPERPPLVVLSWKDWRGEAPELVSMLPPPPTSKPPSAPQTAATSKPASIPPPAPPARAKTPSVPPPSPFNGGPAEALTKRPSVPPPAPSPSPLVPPTSAPSVLPLAEAAPAAPTHETHSPLPPAPPAREVTQPIALVVEAPAPVPLAEPKPPAGPPRGEELLSEAFEAMQDLAFLQEPDQACTFAADRLRELLRTPAVVVWLYDIDKDELVLQTLEGITGTLGVRTPLAQGPRGESAVRDRVVNLPSAWTEDTVKLAVPNGPVVYVSVRHGRLFGAVQLHREPGGPVYSEDEEHTATYIATQLGKWLADHSKRIGFKDEQAGPKG